MSIIDFAAAQQRVAARRQARDAEARSRLERQQDLHTLNALTGLPFPFGGLGKKVLGVRDVLKGREGTRPAFRVGQVDAELLDEELLELLRGQIGEALKYYGVRLLQLDTY